MLRLLYLATITLAVDSRNAAASRPFDVLRELRPLLTRAAALGAALSPNETMLLYTRAAEAYTAARDYDAAVLARERVEGAAARAVAENPTRAAASELLLARVALAEARLSSRDFDDALSVLRIARADVVRFSAPSPPPSRIIGGLIRVEAEALSCSGSPEAALDLYVQGVTSGAASYTSAAWLRTWPAADSPTPFLLESWRLLSRATQNMSVEAARARIGSELVRRGPWTSPLQLPRTFVKGLESAPWHDAPPPGLEALRVRLEEAAPSLLREFRSLPKSLLLREAECIAAGKAEWLYMTVNAPWVEDVDDVGCSRATPVACSIVREAASAGWAGEALRATYSILSGGARLTTHCGMTNAQLKFHVGLSVPVIGADGRTLVVDAGGTAVTASGPHDAATPCATLTVAGVTRAWTAGRAFIFDDSFEHSVVNHCEGIDAERVVMQLVVPFRDN